MTRDQKLIMSIWFPQLLEKEKEKESKKEKENEDNYNRRLR